MKIILDAMGGDDYPTVPLNGAIEALRELENDFDLVLVGDRERIEAHLAQAGEFNRSRVEIVHTEEIVEMGESPSLVLRKKKNSSISVGVALAAQAADSAFISAGNTGAAMAAGLRGMGRIPGISRPGICSVFPTSDKPCVLLDVGANVDSKPLHLLHFAMMGAIYSEKVLGVKRPKIGLLNIGEEPSKGDELSIETHKLLEKSELNFVGNVEGRDIFDSVADVVVCDGFVGNVVLKVSERVLGLVVEELKSQIKSNPLSALGFLLMKPVFQGLKKSFDYAEYGGAPLLGINGTLIICHGGSNARAIRNAIRLARLAILNDLNGNIARVVNK